MFLKILFYLLIFTQTKMIWAKVVELSFPTREYSIETLNESIGSLIKTENKLYLFPMDNSLILEVTFNAEGKTREDKFGKLIDMKRIQFAELKNHGPWIGGIVKGKKVALLDGYDVGLGDLNLEFSSLLFQGIIYDKINPLADRGGQAPKFEQRSFRQNFLSQFNKTKDEKFTGVSIIDESKNTLKALFLTQIKNTPLLLAECHVENINQCQILHACQFPLKDVKDQTNFFGLAFDKKNSLLLIGDRVNQKILVYEYKSCYSSKKIGEIFLPKKMKTLGSIFLDDLGNLWVTALSKDDYLNASVYYWERGVWWK